MWSYKKGKNGKGGGDKEMKQMGKKGLIRKIRNVNGNKERKKGRWSWKRNKDCGREIKKGGVLEKIK